MLSKLCFLCGNFFKKSFSIENHKDKIKTAFYIDVTPCSDNSIFPSKICERCYLKLKNIIKGSSTLEPMKPINWKEHDPVACSVCSTQPDRRGGKRIKNISKNIGRPNLTMETVWTRKRSEQLKSTTKDVISNFHELTDPTLIDIPSTLNPQMKHCLCKLCSTLLSRSIKITTCEDVFCYNCLLPKIEGKLADRATVSCL